MGFLDSVTKYAPGIGAITGIASTIGGMLGSIGQGKRQRRNMDYQYELNKRMYEQQRDDNLQMYERQLADQRALIADERAYNDFSSVAARARKAGVNPLAVFDNGGVGIQSSAGSTPSYNAPSAGSSSIPGVDSLGANLISGGATISNITRTSALLDAEVRQAEAEARKAEIEAHWKDKDISSIILNRDEQTKLYSAGIKNTDEQTRWYSLDNDLKEQEKEFKETFNPIYLDQMRTTLRQQELLVDKVSFEVETQREAFRAKMKESTAYVANVYSQIDERLKNIELRAEELNLSQKELDEVRAKRHMLERQYERTQDFYEKQETKKLNHQIAQGYLSEANKLLSTASDTIIGLGNIAVKAVDAGIPL